MAITPVGVYEAPAILETFNALEVMGAAEGTAIGTGSLITPVE